MTYCSRREQSTQRNLRKSEEGVSLASLREEDILVLWRLDRLAEALDLIELTNQLQANRIDLGSLTEKLDNGRGQESLFFNDFAVRRSLFRASTRSPRESRL
jgi:DNA invertase Pin-like site-specific DNA recombinase